MKFDLFYELSLPPFGHRSEAQLYTETLEELELADRLGFNSAWLVEHHFMQEYSHSSAPDLFLAAAAQRTNRLRLGLGIIPLPYHHPVQVAERVATLDLLSQGRLEIGVGRGFSPFEYATFGVDMAESRTLTEEALAILRQSFRGEINFRGRHFSFEQLNTLPKPLQRPHPPLWGAAVSPESFELAASEGLGVLAGPFKPWFMVREDIKRYRSAWTQREGGDEREGLNPRVGMTLAVYCLADGAEARRRAAAGFEWFYQRLLTQTRPILERLHLSYDYYRRWGPLSALLSQTINLALLERLGMVIVGDPAHCRKRIEALSRAGVDHCLCAFGAGSMPSQPIREAMRLWAEEVMPAFQNSDASPVRS